MSAGSAGDRYVIFDLGGVLIDWNPRYLYRKLLSEAEADRFVTEIVHPAWNAQMDAGVPFHEALAERKRAHPEHDALIDAYWDRWDEMLGGAVDGTVDVLRELREAGVPLYALTNWSAETFHHATRRFAFLAWFIDILVSGRERLVKPDPRIYTRLLERNALDPAQGLFVDDVPKNVEGAERVGLDAVWFRDASALRDELRRRHLLV